MAKQNTETEKESERTSLRDQLLGRIERDDLGQQNREISVMTRMSTEIVEILDALVELEIFKSRSEAVAAYVENAIINNSELYESLIEQAQEVSEMRDSAMDSILQTLKEKK